MNGRILVVEDEPAISEAVAYALREAGYEVDEVADGDAALAAAREKHYDLMVLDLVLPRRPGLDVCRTIRAESDLPIVILTGRDAEADRLTGREIGADDYVTKPFSLAELVSRVRALLRRRELDRAASTMVQKVGGLELDSMELAATVDGREVSLTRSEFRLVAHLASAPGQVFTREELVRDLWHSDFAGDQRAIDVHISNLRRKLEPEARNPRRLVTVRGVGYMLVAV
jgi:two-component system response regulator RegX3